MTKTESKHFEKRQEILTYALDCFYQQGFAATTIKDIAAAAGMKSTALLYYYFKDKDALFQACMFDAQMPPLKDFPMDMELGDFLFQIQLCFLDMINDAKIKKLLICAVSVIEARPDMMNEINEKYRRPYRDIFVRFIQNGVDRGAYRPMDPWSLYMDVFTPLFMHCLIVRDWEDWDNPEKRDKYIAEVRERTDRFVLAIVTKPKDENC